MSVPTPIDHPIGDARKKVSNDVGMDASTPEVIAEYAASPVKEPGTRAIRACFLFSRFSVLSTSLVRPLSVTCWQTCWQMVLAALPAAINPFIIELLVIISIKHWMRFVGREWQLHAIFCFSKLLPIKNCKEENQQVIMNIYSV